MLSIENVLHPTDFSEGADVAFDHALHLARHYEAELHVLHVVPAPGNDPIRHTHDAAAAADAFAEEALKKADARLRDLVAAHQHSRVSIRRVLSQGTAAAPVILDYAEKERIDVVVMGTHGRRGIKHLLLGSVAEEVVHRTPCHVVTVRRQKGSADEARPLQRILAPIDFSASAAGALQVARAIASSYGAQLHLLHVIQPLPFSLSLSIPLSIHELAPGILEKTHAQLEAFFDQVPGPAVPVEVHVVEGEPARTIVSTAADEQIDLILLAPRGLTGIERFFLGSVAEYVVRTATCPVFTAKAAVPEAPEDAAAVG